MVGVSSIIFYDPIGRTVGVLNPNHTYSKMILTPWHKESWDLNDTVLVSDPKTDPDIGDYFLRLPDDSHLVRRAPDWSSRTGATAVYPKGSWSRKYTNCDTSTPSVGCFSVYLKYFSIH
jgi:hypothetical protein